jgi:hypothetical protein
MEGRNRNKHQARRIEFIAVWSVQAARWEVLDSRRNIAIKLAANEREAKALARNLTRLYAAETGPAR